MVVKISALTDLAAVPADDDYIPILDTSASATKKVAYKKVMKGYEKLIQLKILDDATLLTTGDGKLIFCIPSELNGMNLTGAQAYLTTVATGATLVNISIYNLTDSVDMLSTPITIDASEFTSYTAATPPVIDTTKDDVATADRLEINIDAVGNTTAGKGLGVLLTFQLP